MAQQWKIGTAVSAVIFGMCMAVAPAMAAEGGLKPGPVIHAGYELKPVRMGHATADIILQRIGTSPDGVPYFETKKICKVSGEVPVFDMRNQTEVFPKKVYFLDKCEAETVRGKVYLSPVVEIDLVKANYEFESMAGDVKSFVGNLWISPVNDDSHVFETGVGSSASTDDLTLKKLILSVSSNKMTTSQGSEQMDEYFAAQITLVDDGN